MDFNEISNYVSDKAVNHFDIDNYIAPNAKMWFSSKIFGPILKVLYEYHISPYWSIVIILGLVIYFFYFRDILRIKKRGNIVVKYIFYLKEKKQKKDWNDVIYLHLGILVWIFILMASIASQIAMFFDKF